MTFEIQRAESLDGTKRRWIRSPDGAVFVSCPTCGQIIFLGAQRIGADGVVSTQITCPYKDCGFEKHIRLMKWEPPDEVK